MYAVETDRRITHGVVFLPEYLYGANPPPLRLEFDDVIDRISAVAIR